MAILSIGVEEGKGNEVAQASYPLFQSSGLNFIGNVEGCDIVADKADVIICDGFVGNIIVKFSEALGRTIGKWLEEKIGDKLPQVDVRELVDGLITATNAADTTGGGPLLAVDGVACVAHGRSIASEICSAIGQAKRIVELDLVSSLKLELEDARKNLKVPVIN